MGWLITEIHQSVPSQNPVYILPFVAGVTVPEDPVLI